MNFCGRFCFRWRDEPGFFDALITVFVRDSVPEATAVAVRETLAEQVWNWAEAPIQVSSRRPQARSRRDMRIDQLVAAIFDKIPSVAGHAWLEIEPNCSLLQAKMSYYMREVGAIPEAGEVWEFLPHDKALVSTLRFESNLKTWSVGYFAQKGLNLMFRPLLARSEDGGNGAAIFGRAEKRTGSRIAQSISEAALADRIGCSVVFIKELDNGALSLTSPSYSYSPQPPNPHNCVTWVSWALKKAAGTQWHEDVDEYTADPIFVGTDADGESLFTTLSEILFETGRMRHARCWLEPQTCQPFVSKRLP
jgi:hypothetical protein